MSDDSYDGPIIELTINMQYDARTHRRWVKAPKAWASMATDAKEEFLQDEAQAFLEENIETNALVHDSIEAATRTSQKYWNGQFSVDQLEDSYDD